MTGVSILCWVNFCRVGGDVKRKIKQCCPTEDQFIAVLRVVLILEWPHHCTTADPLLKNTL